MLISRSKTQVTIFEKYQVSSRLGNQILLKKKNYKNFLEENLWSQKILKQFQNMCYNNLISLHELRCMKMDRIYL